MEGIFKNRPLFIIAASQFVSDIGNWISMVAVFAAIVFYRGGGVAQTSGIMLAGFGPMILCSPLAGWFCDRFDRKWLMILSEAGSGLAVLGIILTRSIEFIYVFLVLQAVFSSFMIPASQSALPSFVQEEELTRANALLQQLASIVKIGAPLFAAFLLVFLHPQQAMILDVISYALSVLILSFLPGLSPRKEVITSTNEKKELAPQKTDITIFRVLRASKQLLLLFITGFFLVLIIVNFDLLAPVFVRDVLRQNASFFGLLVGLLGLGTLICSAWLLLRKKNMNYWLDIILGCLLLALLPMSVWLTSLLTIQTMRLIVMCIGCLLGGIGNGLVIVQANTLLQILSPHDLLGRFSGSFQSVMAIAQLIGLLGTPLLVPGYISISSFLGIGALALLLLTGCIILMQYRRIRAEPPLIFDSPI